MKCSILGPEAGLESVVRIFNRQLRWTREGIEYEADDKHAKMIIEECEVKSGRASRTPGVVEKDCVREETAMSQTEASRFRGVAARINFLAQDRADIQFAEWQCQ